jgi:hypothetical protein
MVKSNQESNVEQSTQEKRYWSDRSDMMYYNYVYYIARTVAARGNSVLDVGSNRCSYLEWFYWMDRKVSLDQVTPYQAPGIESVRADFLTWEPPGKFDLVLCLQVLEHVPDVEAFSRKWPEGSKYHVHDPVTKTDVERWMGRKPNESVVVRELFHDHKKENRLVAYFNTEKPKQRIRRDDRLNRRPVHPLEFYEERNIEIEPPTTVEAFSLCGSSNHVRSLIENTAPRDATVLVVSRGDDSLLRFDDRRGWHFPRALDGSYAGHYPADSAQAIGHLEELRARGATHIVFPPDAFWWLEYYREFAAYLERHFGLPVVSDTGVVFDIHDTPSHGLFELTQRSGGFRETTSSSKTESRRAATG